jgi:hypothetical protein
MDNSTSNNLVKTLTEKIPQDLSSFEPGVGTTTSVDSESSIFSHFFISYECKIMDSFR